MHLRQLAANLQRRRWVTRAAVEQILQNRAEIESPASRLQSEIEILTSEGKPSSKEDTVKFFDRARRLMSAHEQQLTKDHLRELFKTAQQLGPALHAPQLQVGFWLLDEEMTGGEFRDGVYRSG